MSHVKTYGAFETNTVNLGEFRDKETAITEGVREASVTTWAENGMKVGIWECTPGAFNSSREGFTEICTILSGRVTLEVEGEEPMEFGPGDIMVTPAGWKGVWRVHETVRKQFTIIEESE